ncbi:DUF262 domain-containing protein [Lacticaseibacillus pabuli]
MNFEKQTLDVLFSEGNNLAIPMYQRGYAWGVQEWEDFWNDLTEVVARHAIPASIRHIISA